MDKTAQFWDRIAEKYAKSEIGDMEAYTYTLDRMRSHLSADSKVLELGCGTASTALLLADGVGNITASDVSGAMLDVGRRNAAAQGVDNISFQQAEVRDPALTGPFDAVIALNVLHLLHDLPGALARINALMPIGGLFMSKTICLPERGFSFKFAAIRAILPLMQAIGKAPYVNITRIAELDQMVIDAGFEIIESGNHPAQPPRRFLVARKLRDA